MKPKIIVHGGAWKIAEETHADHIGGTHVAAEAGWDILVRGGTALDAVEKAISVMEDDPTFDAGVGSVLNRTGSIEMDAIIMDGQTLAIGAVAAVRGITNPIQLARHIMQDTDHSLLVGEGAIPLKRFSTSTAFLSVPPTPSAKSSMKRTESPLRCLSAPCPAK